MTPAGDFDAFYAAAWPRLLRTVSGVTQDEQRAQDAVQTAFAQAYAGWERILRTDDPLAYVRRMAINAALADRRRAFRRRESVVADVPEGLTTSEHTDLTERRDEVWRALGALPPRQRAVIVLRYYEDLSERDIADTLGVRPGTVKSHSSAALSSLREALAPNQTAMGEHP